MSYTMNHSTTTQANGGDAALLIGRILLVAIFPISAYSKLIQWPGIVTMLTQAGAPQPLIGGYLAIGAEFLGAALVILGLFARPGALLLILYIVGTTVIAHRFWEFTGPAQFGQIFSFFKNVAMIGGLGVIAAIGPGRYAITPGR